MNVPLKTLIAALSMLTVSAFPIAATASNADEIQQRVKKIGKLNISGEAPVAAAAPAAAAATNTAADPEATAESAATDSSAPVEINAAELYQASCFACHGTGAAGSPILGQKDVWAPRIAQGEATLIEHAINGFNAMPPRGGSVLEDDAIKAIVTYMIESSQ